LGNKGDLKKIAARTDSIKALLKEPDSALDEEKLKERLSKMSGGVYVIKTGGATEIEMNERRERVDDAIKATRAAILGGIVPGGETALINARVKLTPNTEEEEYAYRILRNAVEKPFGKLLSNAGVSSDYFRAKLEDKSFGYGYNVVTNKVENLLETGVVDPTLVVTEALRSAVSVATLLITSDGASVIQEEKNE
jgi:chaperonin GroEL